MDTNQIKKFAQAARSILIEGVRQKLSAYGFDAKGHIEERNLPIKGEDHVIYMGKFIPDVSFYDKWLSLYEHVQHKGIKEVCEEAAYTWFNRFMAIRVMVKNNFIEPVLEYQSETLQIPRIVADARRGIYPQMPEAIRLQLMELMDDDTKTTEQFTLLITAWCRQNPIIHQCFGGIKDYTELLLPNNILDDGFVDMINHTEFISDADYQSAELIGWLYQFYISERKDEVFAKKGKFEADEIPAATQIFTPNWIVKYMVQNTIGRIYLDNNPYTADEFKPKWKYLVEPAEPTPEEAIYHYNDLKELKVGDLACGSGHILNECFDLLYDLYIAEAYSRNQAIEHIFNDNLMGIDLDKRAKQMAQFSLLIKACQKDNRFTDAHCMPRVLTMPEKYEEHPTASLSEILHHVTSGVFSSQMMEEIVNCYDLMQDADSLGSIMKFSISDATRLLLQQTVEHWEKSSFIPPAIESEMPRFKLILALTEKYAALVMNPPYMGGGNMNAVLAKYVKDNYQDGKADLFSTFMILAIDRLSPKGKYGMINMQSWMFLSSFEALRRNILQNCWIENMLHLGPHTFDELSGEVVQNTAFIVSNLSLPNPAGTYFRLIEGKSCSRKKDLFQKSLANLAKDGVYYPNIQQKNFEKIPGCSVGYWVSDSELSCFKENPMLKEVAILCVGLQTGDNNKFIKNWYEVSKFKIGFNCTLLNETLTSELKWYPCNKGGGQRKWYGNQIEVINWQNNGEEIKNCHGSVIRNPNYYFKPSISWNKISSVGITFRYYPKGFINDNASLSIFPNDVNILVLLGWLNSCLFSKLVNLINPTINLQVGNVSSSPYLSLVSSENVVKENISISKLDWDAHETSWDFQRPELLAIDAETYMDNINWQIEKHYQETGEQICIDAAAPELDSLEWRYEQYCQKWERLFYQLHANEEELNRQFIEIYGLQDELTPDVPLKEITILQQGEISVEDTYFITDQDGHRLVTKEGLPITTGGKEYLKWHSDVIIKQFISYAIGCMMGRYRLDKPGLQIAHPNPSDEEVCTYRYNNENFTIDDDAIIPLMSDRESSFADNATDRLKAFLRIVFGAERLTDNLNFIESALGKDLDTYFMKDFWKDHLTRYQRKPIYWLFASKKGAFQCITYMHRMNPYTVEQIRNKYLLPHIEYLNTRIAEMDARAATLTTKERKDLQRFQKNLDDCMEYHERLHVIADQQIDFDLDDGVTVNHAKFGDVVAKLK